MKSTVRIGNAQAFWGDRSDAAAELLAQEPELDYLTMDYLAEVSMSILAAQRERDPSAGYPKDFVEVVRSLAPYWTAGGRCRLIANAGGLNPRGCAKACAATLEASHCRPMTIAVVSGDDVLAQIQSDAPIDASQYRNLDSGGSIREVAGRLVTANAYIGSAPIAKALADGADIIITGRVADPSLTVGACLHHFGWKHDDWDRLAGATVAGHLIECGTQVTGGISTDWLEVPDSGHIGFPIVEVSADGSCTVTKPLGTGGTVTEGTVKEQLVYEIGDPDSYLSPDVTVSFLSLKVQELGNDRVRVSGAKGREAPKTLKVSATYRDGYWAAGTLTIIGHDARQKAQRCGEIVLARVREAGHELRESVIECIGGESAHSSSPEQTVLRIAVSAPTSAAVERFSKELMPLITAGPPGTTGYAEGRPRVHSLIRYWPCLIPRDAVMPEVEVLTTTCTSSPVPKLPPSNARARRPATPAADTQIRPLAAPRSLADIARTRSGDKGSSSNIGVIARRAEDYEFLKTWLTAERVGDFFKPMGATSAVRYEMPNLSAFNFVLKDILSNSLRTDAQGKALGQTLLAMPFE
ncbi:MAG TPA: acyclic terpene utilization AtuA family protein [Caulifigura sp.]|nr:acyclic terpene utilization AtuA family protein [Caulifigura sp.]